MTVAIFRYQCSHYYRKKLSRVTGANISHSITKVQTHIFIYPLSIYYKFLVSISSSSIIRFSRVTELMK